MKEARTGSSKPVIASTVASQRNTTTLNQWIFDNVNIYITGRSAEITSENKNSAIFCKSNGITAEIIGFNLIDVTPAKTCSSLFESFETVIALDVSDLNFKKNQVLSNCFELLKNGGHLIILLPAHAAIYNDLDEGMDSWKVDNIMFIRSLIGPDKKIVKIRYFNLSTTGFKLGFPFRNYNKAVPMFNMAENHPYKLPGLNMVSVIKKIS